MLGKRAAGHTHSIGNPWREAEPTTDDGRSYYSSGVQLTRSSSWKGFRGISGVVIKNKLHVHLSAPAGGCSRQDTEQLFPPQTQQRRAPRRAAASPQTPILFLMTEN